MHTFNTPDWESNLIGNKSAKQLLSFPVNYKDVKKQKKLRKKKQTGLKDNLTNTENRNRKNGNPNVQNEKSYLNTVIKHKKLQKGNKSPFKDNLAKKDINREYVKSKIKNKNLSLHSSVNKSIFKNKNVTKHEAIGYNSLAFKAKDKIGKRFPVRSSDPGKETISSATKLIKKINKKKMARIKKRKKQNESNIEINVSGYTQPEHNRINTIKAKDKIGKRFPVKYNDPDKKTTSSITKLKMKKRKKKNKSDIEINISGYAQAEDNQINTIQNHTKKNKKLEQNNTVPLTSIENRKSKLIALLSSVPVLKQKKKTLTLKQRMIEKLKASRFRYINEQIYNSESREAHTFFKSDPDAFYTYHDGYRQQVSKWPLNPLDVIIKSIRKMPADYVVADFGCGEANLAKSVPHKVHSFDLVSMNEYVTACDMCHVPLENDSVNVVVFCLSLMGTNIREYLYEANRVLKNGGKLKIAEVESRFDTSDVFIEGVKQFGFRNIWTDLSHNLFYFIDFEKISKCKPLKKLPTVGLHPCLYKKR